MKILIYDHGLFTSLAERLARDVEQVGYFAPWKSGFPDGCELCVGDGLEGVHRVKNFFNAVSDYDLIVFPDVQDADLQQHLRSMGKLVWGSGKGSELELLRWTTCQKFKHIGLPENHVEKVTGVKALREYIKEHEDVFVKVSTFRGLMETWHAKNYKDAEPRLDALESELGPRKEIVEFVVEDSIPDANEIGYDGYCIDGKFPKTGFWGVEIKDRAYLGNACKYDELPDGVRMVNDCLQPLLEESQYRNFFSTEIRESDAPHLIDVTARHASPAGELYVEQIENLPEVLWQGASGILVEPVISQPWGAQIILQSDWAEKHWQPVSFPEDIRRFVKLYYHARINGQDYVTPKHFNGMREIGSVIGLGKTMDEAVENAKENAAKVEGFQIHPDGDALDEAVEVFENAS